MSLHRFVKNIARIVKAALHKLTGKSSLNVRFSEHGFKDFAFPVCPGHDPQGHHDHHDHDDGLPAYSHHDRFPPIFSLAEWGGKTFWSELFLLAK